MYSINKGLITIYYSWTDFKTIIENKELRIQYVDGYQISGDYPSYEIFAIDDIVVYHTVIYKSNIPNVCSCTQEENDTWKTDFETNFKTTANLRISPPYID